MPARQSSLVIAVLASLLAVALSACARAAPAPAPALRLERVVMLMRHGVRPPTRELPAGVADRPWPAWPVAYGELTAHGAAAIRNLGEWERGQWRRRGLLAQDGCPGADDVAIVASYKSRTQDTARAMVEGLFPGCRVDIAFPASEETDTLFHPPLAMDPADAVRAVEALAPAGGMAAEVAAQSAQFALLERTLGCCEPVYCAASALPADCRLSQLPAGVVGHGDDRPAIGDPFSTASTLSQTFLLEYLEGMPMQDVAWGRLDADGIGRLLELNTLKFHYEGAPAIVVQTAGPLAARMLAALQDGPAYTLLAGHDTNVADLGALLGLHWQVPGFPRDNVPPGSALGFELRVDADGREFVRAFYRAQTMPQIRELQALDDANPPFLAYLPIPGCAADCALEDFARIVDAGAAPAAMR